MLLLENEAMSLSPFSPTVPALSKSSASATAPLKKLTAFCPFTLVRATGDSDEATAMAWLDAISRHQTAARTHADLRASAPSAGTLRTPTLPRRLTSRKVLVAEYPRSVLEERIRQEQSGGEQQLSLGKELVAKSEEDPLLNVYLIDFHFAEHLVAYCPALDHMFARENVSSVHSISEQFSLHDASWVDETIMCTPIMKHTPSEDVPMLFHIRRSG